MLADLINQPVVILSRSVGDPDDLDEAGNVIDSETAVQTVACLQPRRTDEQTDHPDIGESDWVGYFLPPDADYVNSASLVWAPDMGEYDVVGIAPTWTNPRTLVEEYVEVNLKRVAGPADSEAS